MSLKNSLEKLKAAMRYDMMPLGSNPDMMQQGQMGNYGGYTNCCTKEVKGRLPYDNIYGVVCNGKLVAEGRIGSLGEGAKYLPACPS